MKNWPGLTITDGTAQDGRFLPALQDGYFLPDEMTFEELLAMGADLASAVQFVNLRNEPDGSWSHLLAADSVTVMAQITSLDLSMLEVEFVRRSNFGVYVAARFVVGIAQRLDAWFKTLNVADDEAGKMLGQHLAEVIVARLATHMQNIGMLAGGSQQRQGQLAARELSGLDPIWGIQWQKAIGAAPSSPHPEELDLMSATNTVQTAFDTFSHALTYLKELAPAYLQASLRTHTHNPAVGLFLAFLKLYPHAQGAINRFTQRHLRFYYGQVLKLTPRQAVAGRIHLLLEMVAGASEVFIPKGTAFSADQEKREHPCIYLADTEVIVTDAAVKSLCTFHCARDPQISPESELNYITGVHTHSVTITPAPEEDAALSPFPLFGVDRVDAKQGLGAEASIGFAVASPILLLKEGRRTVKMVIDFADPFASEKVGGVPLLARVAQAETKGEFSKLLGLVFNRYLLTGQAWLTQEDKRGIVEKSRTFADSTLSTELIDRLLSQDRELWFYQYFKNIFTISLTVQSGWHDVSGYVLTLPTDHDPETPHGLKCQFTLGAEVEPIVPYVPAIHGGGWHTRAAVARFVMNEGNDISPYSFFDGFTIREIVIETTVEGAKDLLVYNQDGQLDPSKPFLPLGPIPRAQSYFIVGNYEAAQKNLIDIDLHIEWGELPGDDDGFRSYYKGYDTPFNNAIFEADAAILCDGQWQPEEREYRARISLFDTQRTGERLSENKVLHVTAQNYFKPVDSGISEEGFRFDQRTRNGFFKFTLTSPDYAFGHGEYPALLTRTLSENARLKLAFVKPIPNPPYTPRINRIGLNYTARSVMTLGLSAGKADTLFDDKLIHLHPFGNEILYPNNTMTLPSLLPQYQYDGNLFIGLAARELKGPLTLFFYMREDSTQDVAAGKTDIAWFYLSGNQWHRFEAARILSNTTDGFLCSGIVTLDVPDDIDRNNSVMPQGLFWLRVAANENLHSFCSLYSVRAHALSASRRSEEGAWAGPGESISATAVWRPVVSIPGIGKISRMGVPFGERPAESERQMQTRGSERLRHKYRASMPWDYEQLILERFPNVYKVKCFSNMRIGADAPCPGHVLIVVVPLLKEPVAEKDFTPMMNALELSQIQEFVRQLAAPFVELDVRNPVYEWIQIRCTVKLSSGAHHGLSINRLNQALNEYLSPWQDVGGKVKFGWCIRRKEVEAYIRSFDFVDFVTNFSMLHITQDEKGAFTLGDTAQAFPEGLQASQPQPGVTGDSDEIRPKYPWSLPLPLTKHFIETTDELERIDARATGINELAIGHTFIIGPKEHHG